MSTSDQVPRVWPVAVNGVGYALDDQPNVYEDRSIPTLRNVATGVTVDETTLNPERGFLRSFTSFKRGAGQSYYDRDDSDEFRCRDSWRIEMFDEETGLRPIARAVEFLGNETATAPRVVKSIDQSAYGVIVDGLVVNEVVFSSSTTDYLYSRTTGGSSLISAVTSSLWTLAWSSAEIYYLPAGLASATDRKPTGASSITHLVWAHDTFLAAYYHATPGSAGIFELTGDFTTTAFTGTLVKAIGTPADNGQCRGLCRANGGFYFADHHNRIGYISVANDGTLAFEGWKAQLQDLDGIVELHEHLGFIFIVTGLGVRLATQGTDGELTIGSRILAPPSATGFNRMAFSDQYAYMVCATTAIPNRADSNVVPIGMIKMDLTQINDGLVPAWEIGPVFDGQDGTPDYSGAPTSVVAGKNGTNQYVLWVSADSFFYAGDSDVALAGWLSTGWVSWGVGDNKLLQEVALDADGTVTTSYADTDDVDTYATYTNGNEVSDVALDLRFNFTGQSARLRRATARAFPLTVPQREVTLPLILADTMTDLLGRPHKRNALTERNTLAALEGTVVDVQEGQATSYRALVTGHRFVGVQRESGGAYAGTMLLTIKRL